MSSRYRLAFRIGFTYAGTVVGAGFATGQEVLQFFTLYGKYGFLGIFLCIILFSWLGTRMMIVGARLGADSYESLNDYLYGSYWGKWMNRFIGVILFGLTTAMISGAGSLFAEHLNISFHIGVCLTASLSYLVLIRGIHGIMSMNSIVVPLMFIFILLIGIHAFFEGEWTIAYGGMMQNDRYWLISTITYVAFNMVMAQAILVPLGGRVRDENVIHLGGWMGGICLGVMLFACNYAMQLRFDEVIHMEIPIALLISAFGLGVKYLFLFLVWSEILSTLISNVYGLTSNLRQYFSFRPAIIMIFIFLFGYLFSLIGFPTLVRYLYPFFGYCGMIFLFQLIWRRVPAKTE